VIADALIAMSIFFIGAVSGALVCYSRQRRWLRLYRELIQALANMLSRDKDCDRRPA
jgi:hypothetical protein